MIKSGTHIEMTKGYKGEKGAIVYMTDSEFEFYVVELENGIRLVAGPSAFVLSDIGYERTN